MKPAYKTKTPTPCAFATRGFKYAPIDLNMVHNQILYFKKAGGYKLFSPARMQSF